MLCFVGTACDTTAPTGKSLFDDPRGTVSLQTISDRSIQANHPINLEPAVLTQLLKGMKIQDQDLGHNHVNGRMSMDAGPFYTSVPVFSDDQISFLAPLLAEGLRAAAPDQCVEYRVVTTHEGSSRFQSLDHGNHRRFPLCLWPTAVRDTSQYCYNQMRENMSMIRQLLAESLSRFFRPLGLYCVHFERRRTVQ